MKTGKVSRWETTTQRFGRVITYRVTIDGVQFAAERMVGLNVDYTVYTHVGRCGMSHMFNLGTVTAGRNIAERFAELAQRLYDERAFVKTDEPGKRPHAEMCCDKEQCSRWRQESLA